MIWAKWVLATATLWALGGATGAWAQDASDGVPLAVGPGLSKTEPPLGQFERLGLQTSIRAGAWTHDRDLNDETATSVLGLRARIAPGSGAFDAFAEGYAQVDSEDGPDADLVEGWVRLTLGDLEIRAGRQIVVWGRADRLNPTDNISSRDYTSLVVNDDEQRRGNLMLQTRLGLGLFTVDAYWLPEFRASRFPLDRNRPGVAFRPSDQGDDSNQFALKLDHSGSRLDWSISWFRGVDRTRDIVATGFVPPGALVEVQEQFPAISVIGADVAGTVGALGYRAEIAYTDVRGLEGPGRRNGNIWAVAGVDATLGNGWNVNIQYSFRRILDYSDPRGIANPIRRAVAIQSAAATNQLDRTQNGVTFRAARKWIQDTLELELSTIVFFETGDAAIRPKISYAINDKVRVAVGADVFVGPAESYFGRVQSLTGGYLQLNIGF